MFGDARPIRRSIQIMLVVFAATWVIFVATNFVHFGFQWAIVGVSVPMLIGDMAIALPLAWIMLSSERAGWRRGWPRSLAAALIVSVVQAAWDTHVRVLVGLLKMPMWWEQFSTSLPVDIYNTGLLVGLLGFQNAYFRAIDHQTARLAAERSARDAYLASLRLQLNPHFLFNTMNALSSLVVVGRNDEAETMIDRLSAFLRNVLAANPQRLVRLDAEFDLIDDYLAIEQVRFGERLVVEMVLPGELAGMAVPPFLLQPLVENAMKYAVAPSRRPVRLTIAAERQGACWCWVWPTTATGRRATRWDWALASAISASGWRWNMATRRRWRCTPGQPGSR